ncbi:Kunitz trypsin inhibitor 2 [Tanacetum coccineum]
MAMRRVPDYKTVSRTQSRLVEYSITKIPSVRHLVSRFRSRLWVHLTVDDNLVLDYDGNPLEKDASYFIDLPGSRALGGRVALGPALETAETCSADVFLVRVLAIRGTPFTFTPVNSSEDVIKLGSGLAIQSPTENPCGDSYSTVWKVTSSIITNGGISNTGPSCFRITRSKDHNSATCLHV